LYALLSDLGASSALDDADARLMLAEALGGLASEDQRQVILRQLAGERDEQIAEALGRSKQAIYNLRHRALRALRRLIGRGRSTD
jgi:DNA-directed RNA polymerase specialized sigma24 family protein